MEVIYNIFTTDLFKGEKGHIILISLLFLIGYFFYLTFKCFVAPLVTGKWAKIDEVSNMATPIADLLKDYSELTRTIRVDIVHQVRELKTIVQGFGARLEKIEDKHDVFEEKILHRLTTIETKHEEHVRHVQDKIAELKKHID